MTENDHSSTDTNTFLNNAFSAAFWKANVDSLFDVFGLRRGLSDIFGRSARERNFTHEYAIDKNDFLPLVVNALRQKRTEPYLAALMLASNISQPVNQTKNSKLDWNEYLVSLIEQHNAVEPPFNTKRRLLLKMLIEGGLDDYAGLLKGGFMDNHYHLKNKNYKDSEEEVMEDQDDDVPHDRRPSHIDKNGTAEIQDNRLVKTYAAIPKAILLPKLKEAMASGRMCCTQAAMMLAVNCHSMALRRTQERYLDHVMAVAGNPALNAHQRNIALMHDVIEDSNYTFDDLREIGFSSAMIKSLEHMTKRQDETVYLHFIQRVGLDKDATAVKRADIAHNVRDAKPDKVAKYELSDLYLEAIQKRAIKPGTSIEAFFYYVEDMKADKIKPDYITLDQYASSPYYSQAVINYKEQFDTLFTPEIKNQHGQFVPAMHAGDSPSVQPA